MMSRLILLCLAVGALVALQANASNDHEAHAAGNQENRAEGAPEAPQSTPGSHNDPGLNDPASSATAHEAYFGDEGGAASEGHKDSKGAPQAEPPAGHDASESLRELQQRQKERTEQLRAARAQRQEKLERELLEKRAGADAAERGSAAQVEPTDDIEEFGVNQEALDDAQRPGDTGTVEPPLDQEDAPEVLPVRPAHPAEDVFRDALDARAKSYNSAYMQGLQKAVDAKHPEATYMLAMHRLIGNMSFVEQNITEAFELVQEPASAGFPQAQWLLGFMYSAGLGTNSSQAKSLVYMTFAALGGSSEAQMSMGYRHFQGNTVEKSCEQSMSYYRRVAEKVESNVQLTGGAAVDRKRLTDTESGGHSQEDLVQYYQYNAVRGDANAQAIIGQVYYQGGHGIEQDYNQAFRFFEQAAEQGDVASMAALGEMHQAGLGTKASNETAFKLYKKAADKNSGAGHSGLGGMYHFGLGVKKDVKLAFNHYKQAAKLGHADGQLNLGHMYSEGLGVQRDYRKAIENYRLASQQGHVLGMYNLAYMHATGRGVPRLCEVANALYKNVAERGEWAKTFEDAYLAYEDGKLEQAIVQYLILAEAGYELGQHNAAFILERENVGLFNINGTHKRAYVNWKRSAEQGYSMAHVKLGDHLYYGLGTEVDMTAAAAEYRAAVDSQIPQAMFNLGYMHEQGLGLGKDLHLAKRYYDMAIETSADAKVPAGLALIVLQLKFWLSHFSDEGSTLYDIAMTEYSWSDVEAFVTEWENAIFFSLLALLIAVVLGHYSRFRPREQ